MFASKKQMERSRLGRLLINRGYITQEQLKEALMIQRKKGARLGRVMVDQGLISDAELNRTLKHQERYRYVAALVAVVVTPLQPLAAFASGSAGASIPDKRPVASQLQNFSKASGLRSLGEEALGQVTARGFVEDAQWLSGAVSQAKDGQVPIDEESDETGQVKMLAHLVLPMTNFMDLEARVEGVRYGNPGQLMTFGDDGGLQLAFPSHIDRFSTENIKPTGSSGAVFGSLYFTDISMKMDVTIRPHF